MNILVLILGLLAAFGPLSIDMYLPSLPDIAKSFNTDLSQVQFSLASFFVGLAIGQVFYGPLTDRFGRKKPLYVGLTIYALSSLGCALSHNAESLIFFRFLQALGSCAGMVISRAIVRDKYHAKESARIFSLLMLIMGVAPILAPLLGGQISAFWGWRGLFWVLFAISLFTLLGVIFLLPETHRPDRGVKFSETLKVYGSIIKDREFLGYTLSGGLAQSGLFAYITGSPFVFMSHFKVSPQSYATIFGLNAFGLILFSQINGHLLKRHTPQKILRRVYPMTALMGLVLMLCGTYGAGLFTIGLSIFLFMSFLGMTFPNSTASSLESQGLKAGSASALLGTMQFSLSAISSGLVSYFHNGTLVPMTMIIGLCGMGAFVVFKLVVPKKVPILA